jgi:hypothetical protein
MDILSHQHAFLCDVAKLIQFADNRGIHITGGELFRSNEQQELYLKQKKTNAKLSNHQKRLAIDFNFIIDGELTYEKEDIRPYGDYWKSLNPLNKWGGDFKSLVDSDHFERNI